MTATTTTTTTTSATTTMTTTTTSVAATAASATDAGAAASSSQLQPAAVSLNLADMFNPSPFWLNADIEASVTAIEESLPLWRMLLCQW